MFDGMRLSSGIYDFLIKQNCAKEDVVPLWVHIKKRRAKHQRFVVTLAFAIGGNRYFPGGRRRAILVLSVKTIPSEDTSR
jgi:hypothetical protein